MTNRTYLSGTRIGRCVCRAWVLAGLLMLPAQSGAELIWDGAQQVEAASGNAVISENITLDGNTTLNLFFGVEYLVVGGGGAGGTPINNNASGGGGAGGLLKYVAGEDDNTGTGPLALEAEAYAVFVGDGGKGVTATGTTGESGENSSFDALTALGGGGGGHNTSTGSVGGSGGGGGSNDRSGSAGTPGQGFAGGAGVDGGGNSERTGGGGGGAGTALGMATAGTDNHASAADEPVRPGAKAGIFYVEDYAENGKITRESILRATAAAAGRPVIFPAGATILLPSGRAGIKVPVHWCAGGTTGCTLKVDPDAAHNTGPWWYFENSVTLEGMHFDGSDKHNKGLRIAPQQIDARVILRDGSAHHFKQRADENGKPISGYACGIESWGRYAHFYAERFDLHHCSADADVGRPRGVTRGLIFSTRSRRGTDGAPRVAELHSCNIYWVHCRDYWGEGQIDADGIVWNNHGDGTSRLLVKACRFWANAKRPIKLNTGGDEATIVDCVFTEETLPQGGYTRYRWFAFQDSSGMVRGCTWDFPAPEAWPSRSVLNASIGRGFGGALLFMDNRVRVRGSGPVDGVLWEYGVQGEPLATDQLVTLRNWSIEVPGGLSHLALVRLSGGGNEADARIRSPRFVMSGITVTKLNGKAWYLINHHDQPYSIATAWINNNLILEGETDAAAWEGDQVIFDATTAS